MTAEAHARPGNLHGGFCWNSFQHLWVTIGKSFPVMSKKDMKQRQRVFTKNVLPWSPSTDGSVVGLLTRPTLSCGLQSMSHSCTASSSLIRELTRRMKGTIIRSHASLKGLSYTKLAWFMLSFATKRGLLFSPLSAAENSTKETREREEMKRTKEAVIEQGGVNN